jgi:hypothetical protein
VDRLEEITCSLEAGEALKATEAVRTENCLLRVELEEVFNTAAKAERERDELKMEIAAELEDRHKVKAKHLEEMTRFLEAGICNGGNSWENWRRPNL